MKIFAIVIFVVILFAVIGCSNNNINNNDPQNFNSDDQGIDEGNNMKKTDYMNNPNLKTAVFAGGCFWCMEAGFEAQDGVLEVISGYTNGQKENPTYDEVSTGKTGYMESVKVYYDSNITNYEKMLESFWILIDPTDAGGQFADRGSQYKTAIFYETDAQKNMAENSKNEIAKKYDKPIATQILPLKNFYEAEEYHQDYYLKQQFHFKTYEKMSGREDFIKQNEKLLAKPDSTDSSNSSSYKRPSDKEIKKMLTDEQFDVTQKEGTESPFNNQYWDNHNDGIYVDVVSGEPLFSSTDKYDSGTGWPSFTKPLEAGNIVEKSDYKLFVKRTEVRSKIANSHLGHVFEDGPAPTGLRYCMNSAALRFIPKEKLDEEGYGQYSYLFDGK